MLISITDAASSFRLNPITENGFVAILDEMLMTMHELGLSSILPPWEGPWTTIQGFKILIILWEALRFSIAELQGQSYSLPSFNKFSKVYDPARVVLHSIITALDINDPLEQHMSHESLFTVEGISNVNRLETQFIHWMRKLCERRDVWDIGPAMGKVLDEVHAME